VTINGALHCPYCYDGSEESIVVARAVLRIIKNGDPDCPYTEKNDADQNH
jgi:hypothetical protein